MHKATIIFLLAGCALAQQHPRDKEIHDADTLAWWHTTEALSGDGMEGRDTGSAAYQRAAEYVARRFRVAGLQPAGNGGTYFQSVAMHEIFPTRSNNLGSRKARASTQPQTPAAS